MELGQAYSEELSESHRRALLDAANELIDTTMSDLSASSDPDWSADSWLIGTLLPTRYRLHYTPAFARKFFMCLVTVVWKLGQAEIIRPPCVAEELAASILIQEAEALLEERGEAADFEAFYDSLFEDTDFEYLFDDAYDGIEKTDLAETMGMTNLAFADWFKRFGPPDTAGYTEVHPYTWANGDGEASDESDANPDANLDDMG